MSAEPLTGLPPNLTVNETRLYSDLEVETLIDELTAAAYEAIEQAAGEAAKAAILVGLERETAALHEMQRWRKEAELNKKTITETKKNGIKNTVIAGLACLLGGLAIGIGGTLAINR
jgi:gamma-glutamyl:cysteine ligase YbdK (ATP-grasp superfamily)